MLKCYVFSTIIGVINNKVSVNTSISIILQNKLLKYPIRQN
jgi:hypothetical protein